MFRVPVRWVSTFQVVVVVERACLVNENRVFVRESFTPPIWRLGIQNPVFVIRPIVFCKSRCSPPLIKAVIVVEFGDEMESVDVAFLVCGIDPFDGPTPMHTAAPLIGLRRESMFARFTHGALIVLVIYINDFFNCFNFKILDIIYII